MISEDTAAIGALLRKVAATGVTVVLVEHDMELVMGVSSHVVVLDAGAKIAEGPPLKVASEPAVLEAYLGSPSKPTASARANSPRASRC